MSSLRFIVSVKRGLCLYLSGLAIVLKTTVPRFFILDKSARGQGTERKTITIKRKELIVQLLLPDGLKLSRFLLRDNTKIAYCGKKYYLINSQAFLLNCPVVLQNRAYYKMKKREDCCSDLSRGSRQPAMQYYTTVCSRPYAIYIGYIIET